MKLYKRSLTDLLFERNDVLFEMASDAATSAAADFRGKINELIIGEYINGGGKRLAFSTAGFKNPRNKSQEWPTSTRWLQYYQQALTAIGRGGDYNEAVIAGVNQGRLVKEWIDSGNAVFDTSRLQKVLWLGPGAAAAEGQEDLSFEYAGGNKIRFSAKLGSSSPTAANPGSVGFLKVLGAGPDILANVTAHQKTLLDDAAKADAAGWKELIASYNDCPALRSDMDNAAEKVSQLYKISSTGDTRKFDAYTLWYNGLQPAKKADYTAPADLQRASSRINEIINDGMKRLIDALAADATTDQLYLLISLVLYVYYPGKFKKDGTMTESEIATAINDITSLEYIVVTRGEVKRMREVQGKLIDFLRAYVANPTTVKSSLRLSTDVMKGGEPTRTSCLWYVNGTTPVQLFSISVSMGKTSGYVKSSKGSARIPIRLMDTTYPIEAGSGSGRDIDDATIIRDTDTSSIESTLSDLGDSLARAVTAARAKLTSLDPTATKKTRQQSASVRLFRAIFETGGKLTAENFVKYTIEQQGKRSFDPAGFTTVLQEYIDTRGMKLDRALDHKVFENFIKNAPKGKRAREEIYDKVVKKALDIHGGIIIANSGNKSKITSKSLKRPKTKGNEKDILKELNRLQIPGKNYKSRIEKLRKWVLKWYQNPNTTSAKFSWRFESDEHRKSFLKAFVSELYNRNLTESRNKDYNLLLTERQKRFWDWAIK